MRIDICNTAWQIGGDAALVRKVAKGDVAAFVECRTRRDTPVSIGRILGRTWRTSQSLTSGAAAGCAIAVNRLATLNVQRTRSFLASLPGRGVQSRYARECVVTEVSANGTVIESHLIVIHNPLLGTDRQDDAVRSIARRVATLEKRAKLTRLRGKRVIRYAIMGDFNMSHDRMRQRIGAPNSKGAEVMGFVYGRGWHDVDLSIRYIKGSDHPVLTITTA